MNWHPAARSQARERGPHDVYVVPRGMEHRPVTTEEAHILMMETTGTRTTGDASEGIPDEIPVTTGQYLD